MSDSETEALPECEIILKENLFNRYFYNLSTKIPDEFKVDRTYEGALNYYIVFAPLSTHIDRKTDMKDIEKYCRDKYAYERICVSREKISKRIHYNVLITTKKNPLEQNGRIVKKYYMNVQHVSNLGGVKKVLQYILKESKHREYKEDIDYYVYKRK